MITMKKQIILLINIAVFILILTACASAKLSLPQISGDGDGSSIIQESEQNTAPVGAEPAQEFSTVKAAVQEIKEAKMAGASKMEHPNDFKLYEKDYIYLLKESPLSGFKQSSVMLVSQGTAIIYRTYEHNNQATFSWTQGDGTDEIVKERINRFNLKRYSDTKFYFGELHDEICIFWWESGDEFAFTYPAEANIAPEDVIVHLEIEKYDL